MRELATALWFRLARTGDSLGVSCDHRGAFIGSIPLLMALPGIRIGPEWEPRCTSELNNALSASYGMPIDVSVKKRGLAAIARALNRGDLAYAQIATLHLHLPDPPLVAKAAGQHQDTARLVALLRWSGVLKGDWDPERHPRTGDPPNRGWFAPVEREPKLPKPGWPTPKVNKELRTWLKRVAKEIGAKGSLVLGGPIGDVMLAIVELIETFSPTDLNDGEDRLIAQSKAYLDPPKTMEELQTGKCDGLGYERHHIVEQHDANRERFGDDVIDDPSNILCIPRLKHEEIGAYYNEKPNGLGTPSRRESISQMSFEEQRERGLTTLRSFGVLQ